MLAVNHPFKRVFTKFQYETKFGLILRFNRPVNLNIPALSNHFGRRVNLSTFPQQKRIGNSHPRGSHHAPTTPFLPHFRNPSPSPHHRLSSILFGTNGRRQTRKGLTDLIAHYLEEVAAQESVRATTRRRMVR